MTMTNDTSAKNSKATTSTEGKVLGIFFSSGDLGDVGRHAVAAALELPPSVVARIRVFSKDISKLLEANWKCNCPKQHSFTQNDRDRLEFVSLDASQDHLVPALEGVHALVSCLGSRQPFPSERIVKQGTQRLVEAALACGISRFVMISSVGIADDWPPMHWSQEGRLLEGFFRTICWGQYQDLTAAEACARAAAQRNPAFDFLIVRPVALSEEAQPVGTWHLQSSKHEDPHPTTQISKMDCARLMVEEAIFPTLSQRAVVLGGDHNQVSCNDHQKSSYEEFAFLNE